MHNLKFSHLYIALTALLGGLPFALYVFERTTGALSSEEIWYRTGVNHGPWRGGVKGLTIYYPIFILMIVTLGVILLRGVRDKKSNLLAFCLVLVSVQVAIMFAQMYLLAWTID